MAAPKPSRSGNRRNTTTPRPLPRGVRARAWATECLKAVLHKGQPFDVTFETVMAKASTDSNDETYSRDKSLARMVATTALRQLGTIRTVITICLDKPLADRALSIEPNLIAGTCELLFLDSAAHGIVDSHVELAKHTSHTRPYANLVNGILRRIDREKQGLLASIDPPLANTPDWLFARWEKAYGAKTAKAIAQMHGEIPPLDLTVPNDRDEWCHILGGTPIGKQTVRLAGQGAVENLAGFEDGAWWVQDIAAALPAQLLDIKPSEIVADLCAAPGGKTAQLCASGATVHAVDIAKGRLKRLHANMTRLSFTPTVHQADAAEWCPTEPLDAILLDAPCSATGTIRRNPDVPWLKSEADIATLAALQTRLLDHAVAILKPGGRMVYCTCSLEHEEGEAQIDALLQRNPSVEVVPIRPDEAPEMEDMITPRGSLRVLPTAIARENPKAGGASGFFIARLQKKRS